MKRLYRSTKEKVISGVCGGLGEYFGVDPVMFRIGFLVSLLCFGTGLMIYIIFWIAVPKNPDIEINPR